MQIVCAHRGAIRSRWRSVSRYAVFRESMLMTWHVTKGHWVIFKVICILQERKHGKEEGIFLWIIKALGFDTRLTVLLEVLSETNATSSKCQSLLLKLTITLVILCHDLVNGFWLNDEVNLLCVAKKNTSLKQLLIQSNIYFVQKKNQSLNIKLGYFLNVSCRKLSYIFSQLNVELIKKCTK